MEVMLIRFAKAIHSSMSMSEFGAETGTMKDMTQEQHQRGGVDESGGGRR